jgi:hypothetical protein
MIKKYVDGIQSVILLFLYRHNMELNIEDGLKKGSDDEEIC